MPDVVQPGTRLVQRYCLEERLGGSRDVTRDGTTYWRAQDELLARPVGICLIAAGGEHAQQVLRAARRAAALTDSRFLRVLDASEVDGVVYVVSEWVSATDLVGLVADGPLPADEARSLTAELAAAMSAAHDVGLAHLCLQPEHVLRTAHGQVKLAGLGVDAAARGLAEDDPATAARIDALGVGAVLYAALTARWPGSGLTGLPPAPYADDALCSPRQVRAGVPHELDEIACRALQIPGRHGGGTLDSPTQVSQALAAAGGTTRLPPVRATGPAEHASSYPTPAVAPYERDRPASRSRAVILAWTAAAVVLVTGLSLFGGQVVMTALDGGDAPSAATDDDGGTEQQQNSRSVGRLGVADISSFDPPPGDGEEHEEQAGLATDRDESTSWTTVDYYDPIPSPGLKEGVGLLVDLGAPADVSEVVVRVEGGPTDLQIRVAEQKGEVRSDFDVFDRTANADGPTTLRVSDPVRARYVLVWLSALPAVGGNYVGEISEISVRGSAV